MPSQQEIQKKKSQVLRSIMKNPKLNRMVLEALKAPAGSTKRAQSGSMVSIMKKMSGLHDGAGGPGGAMTADVSSSQYTPAVVSPYNPGTIPGSTFIFPSAPKLKSFSGGNQGPVNTTNSGSGGPGDGQGGPGDDATDVSDMMLMSNNPSQFLGVTPPSTVSLNTPTTNPSTTASTPTNQGLVIAGFNSPIQPGQYSDLTNNLKSIAQNKLLQAKSQQANNKMYPYYANTSTGYLPINSQLSQDPISQGAGAQSTVPSPQQNPTQQQNGQQMGPTGTGGPGDIPDDLLATSTPPGGSQTPQTAPNPWASTPINLGGMGAGILPTSGMGYPSTQVASSSMPSGNGLGNAIIGAIGGALNSIQPLQGPQAPAWSVLNNYVSPASQTSQNNPSYSSGYQEATSSPATSGSTESTGNIGNTDSATGPQPYTDLPAASPSDYFYKQYPSGATVGASTMLDNGGVPFLAFRNPGDTATSTDMTRVASTFDPTVAQPLTIQQFLDPRAVANRAALKKSMGGTYSDELDHIIPLELSGSNDPSNLRIEPNIPGTNNTATDPLENQLAGEVVSGKLSLFDAQVQMAKDKGTPIPWTVNNPTSGTPGATIQGSGSTTQQPYTGLPTGATPFVSSSAPVANITGGSATNSTDNQTVAPVSTGGSTPADTSGTTSPTDTGGTSGTSSGLPQPLEDALNQGIGPDAFAMQAMNDTQELQKLFPGVPVSELPTGGSLAGQIQNIQTALQKEYNVNGLQQQLQALQQQGQVLPQQNADYIRGRDNYLGYIDGMIDRTQTSIQGMDMSNPSVSNMMNNYLTYLYTLKGAQNQSYADYADQATTNYNTAVTNLENQYTQAETNYTNAFNTQAPIAQADYNQMYTALTNLYNNSSTLAGSGDSANVISAELNGANMNIGQDTLDSIKKQADWLPDVKLISDSGIFTDKDGILKPGITLANTYSQLISQGYNPNAIMEFFNETMNDTLNMKQLPSKASDPLDTGVSEDTKYTDGNSFANQFLNYATSGGQGITDIANGVISNWQTHISSYVSENSGSVKSAIMDLVGKSGSNSLPSESVWAAKYPNLNYSFLQDLYNTTELNLSQGGTINQTYGGGDNVSAAKATTIASNVSTAIAEAYKYQIALAEQGIQPAASTGGYNLTGNTN